MQIDLIHLNLASPTHVYFQKYLQYMHHFQGAHQSAGNIPIANAQNLASKFSPSTTSTQQSKSTFL
jgi:hypothetical protein